MPVVVVLLLALALLAAACGGGQQDSGSGGGSDAPSGEPADARRVRPLVLYTQTQGESPTEFESGRLIAEAMGQLGVEVEHRPLPWGQLADLVWYDRDAWDMTMWQMVARPERLDPDEMTFNLFHSSTAETGYNFPGYINPDYDAVAEQQRVTVDRTERQALVHQAQAIFAEDHPYVMTVYPHRPFAFRNDVWKADTIVDAKGLGIRNFWTFIEAEPVGSQRDMVLNSSIVVQGINPFWISGDIDSRVTELIWDRLMRMGRDGLPEPWAAESVTWVDNQTVEVVVRQGMTWHDGRPVTVEDVIFSFEAPMMGDEVPMYKPFVANIDRIEQVDDWTLRFHLKEPSAAFETTTLAKVNLVPKHIWEPILQDLLEKPENAESYQEEVPIGSGPFRFVHWRQGEEIKLSRFDDHWAAPQMDSWILRIIPNQEAALGALRSGEINFLFDYNGDAEILAEAADAEPNITMMSSETADIRFLAFNHRRPPFDNKAFRNAVDLVVPKDVIAENVFRGFATPATSFIGRVLDYWHNSDLTWEVNVERARQVLAEAGFEWDSQGRLLYPAGQVEETEPSP